MKKTFLFILILCVILFANCKHNSNNNESNYTNVSIKTLNNCNIMILYMFEPKMVFY